MRTTRAYKKVLAAYRDPPFRFLSLPVELRLNIYSYLLMPNGNVDLRTPFFHHPNLVKATTESTAFALASEAATWEVVAEKEWIFLQTLSVCRVIHEEAYPIFYNSHHFSFRGELIMPSEYLTFETQFFNRLEPKKAIRLRHIEVETNVYNRVPRMTQQGDRTGEYTTVEKLLDFLERNKAKLNLHSCTITTKKTSYTYLMRPPLPPPSHDDYAAQIQQLWNVDSFEETKSMWEAVLKICKEIFPVMVASREVKDVNHTDYVSSRTYKAVASKG